MEVAARGILESKEEENKVRLPDKGTSIPFKCLHYPSRAFEPHNVFILAVRSQVSLQKKLSLNNVVATNQHADLNESSLYESQ